MAWWNHPQIYLDIRRNEVRILEGKARGNRLRIDRWTVWGADNLLGRAAESDAVRERGVELGEFLEKHGFLKKRAAVVLGQEGIIVRTIQIPAISPKLLGNFLKEQIGEFLPINLSEYAHDYRLTGRLPGKGQEGSSWQILLAAVPRYLIDQAAMFCEAAGLKLRAIDVLPNVQFNVFTYAPYKDLMVIEGENGRAYFTLFADRSILLYAEVPFPFVPEEETDASFILDSLLEETRGYLNFFASRHQGRTLEAVYLTGRLPGLFGEELRRRWELELGVRLLCRAEEFVELSYQGDNANKFKRLAPLYTGNIGLMLKEY